MDSSCRSVLNSKKEMPFPPPLPGRMTASYSSKQKIMGCSSGNNFACKPTPNMWDRLFDEGYRADILINTDSGNIIYAHASILGMASPVLRHMLNQSKGKGRQRIISRKGRGQQKSISIRGVAHEAVRVFVRFLYSSCYERAELMEHILSLLVLSHAYVVPRLKQICERQLENGFLTTENAIDILQLALLCDAPRLTLICHRFIIKNLKAVAASEGWQVMKESHPILEDELLGSMIYDDAARKEKRIKMKNRKIFVQLYDAMEALVHICRDGCQTIGPYDKVIQKNQMPCQYESCKGLEALFRHLSRCKLRVPGGCKHCKRMWQLLELHSRLCADSDICRVPLCRNLKYRIEMQSKNKKDDIKWRILVRKIVRTRSITGAPYFSLAFT
ncbi:BTB/POZ and TAZ domain-containing protein 4-like [Apium graveolens]|uniref:BTB/POZ and TAZ domain-containing protein 4-like n=1 Tax=Apium graveolens TaxID=4045 RepID=UPI003D79D2A7